MFRRKGADLVIEKNLTLVESLCGFDFSITHMDKRTLRVRSNPGQVRTMYLYLIFVCMYDDESLVFFVLSTQRLCCCVLLWCIAVRLDRAVPCVPCLAVIVTAAAYPSAGGRYRSMYVFVTILTLVVPVA